MNIELKKDIINKFNYHKTPSKMTINSYGKYLFFSLF